MRCTTAEACIPESIDSVPTASRYETLRLAALGEPLAPECRGGLLLFLRRGMWSWAQAQAQAALMPPQQPSRPSSIHTPPPHQRKAVVHILASMARRDSKERAR